MAATVEASEGFEPLREEYLDLEVGFLKVQLPLKQLKRLSERYFRALYTEKLESLCHTLASSGLIPTELR